MTVSLTLTLPSTPSTGNWVGYSNLSGATTCVIDPGSKSINSTTGTMTINILNAAVFLVYSSSGWVLV